MEFPVDLVKKMGQLGLMGVAVSEQYGGAGLDYVSYAIVIEELSRVDASLGVIASVNNSLVCYGIETFGTEEQKRELLTPLASGRMLGAFSLSEPGAGSDAAAQKTTAVRDGDEYVINGIKNWVTNGDYADTIILMAMTDPSRGIGGSPPFWSIRMRRGAALSKLSTNWASAAPIRARWRMTITACQRGEGWAKRGRDSRLQ